MDYGEFVHEYVDADGRTRYVVARRFRGRLFAPLTSWAMWVSDADWLVGDCAADVAVDWVTFVYDRWEDAVRRARDLYGDDDEAETP